MLVGRGLAAVHGKFVSPVGVQAWFKGGAANCGYKWRETIDCGEVGCRGRVVEAWSDGWEVDLPFATGFFQRPDDVPRYLEAVCNPNDCERAENLCCQPIGSFKAFLHQTSPKDFRLDCCSEPLAAAACRP